jgi:hypothetical protein
MEFNMQAEFWVITGDSADELQQALDAFKRDVLSKYTRIEQLTTSIAHGSTSSVHNADITEQTTFTYNGTLYALVSAMVEA